MKKVLTILTILIFSFNGNATHLVGGDFKITMTNNGASSSNYDIQLRLYRDDVNGLVNMPTSVTIGIYQIGTNILQTTKVLYLDNNSGSIVPLGDDCFSPNPAVIRVEEGVYNGLTSTILPNFSMGYYIQYQTCCRNASVANLADPDSDGISIFAIIPDPAFGQNSSPDFGNYPNDAYFCLNSTNSFIWPVTDPDGDSLVFSLVQPLNDGNGGINGNSSSGNGAYPFYPTCIYGPGYSLTSLGPGSPMTINSVTGEIFGSPAIIGNFVFAVRVEEYRNGVKIGEVRRDVQYAVEPLCLVLVRVDSIVSCDSLTWIDGNIYTASNNSATYTIQNTAGCDTIIALNLTINSNQFNTDFIVNQTLFTAPPFAAQFANTTPFPSNYNFTWDFGDDTILQSNNASVFHEYQYNGLYDVTLIAENIFTGCTDTMLKTDNIYCSGGPSVSIIEVSSQINVFPNPTNQNTTISIENFTGNIQTEVYDLIGNMLQTTNETTISLQDYARGIYLLKVAYGDRVEEIKVIKQ